MKAQEIKKLINLEIHTAPMGKSFPYNGKKYYSCADYTANSTRLRRFFKSRLTDDHSEIIVKLLEKATNLTPTDINTCPKCSGSGKLSHYVHVDGVVTFKLGVIGLVKH